MVIEGGEWIVIVLVALIVFGPERLPELARRTGDWVRELRGAAREMRELGWERAARVARLHVSSRGNAATVLVRAARARNWKGLASLARHVAS